MEELNIEEIRKHLSTNELIYKSTHARLSFKILQRIYSKLCLGIKLGEIKVSQNMIINGHHRYVCMSFLNLNVETITWTKNSEGVDKITEWIDVEIADEEWDNEADIKRYNEIWKVY